MRAKPPQNEELILKLSLDRYQKLALLNDESLSCTDSASSFSLKDASINRRYHAVFT